jgi:hypothetical protein
MSTLVLNFCRYLPTLGNCKLVNFFQYNYTLYDRSPSLFDSWNAGSGGGGGGTSTNSFNLVLNSLEIC